VKVPEAVLKAYSDSLRETAVDSNQPGPDPVKALEAALEQLREELISAVAEVLVEHGNRDNARDEAKRVVNSVLEAQ
jgi:hypothetical protein